MFASAVALSEVAAVAHEARDDVVEDGALEGERVRVRVRRWRRGPEVLRDQGHLVIVQVHLDPVLVDAVDGEMSKNTRGFFSAAMSRDSKTSRALEQFFSSSAMHGDFDRPGS
jgi:hypothetical protein